MADVSVRPAVVSDAAELARIQVQSWRTAYATILPQPILDSLSEDAAAAIWSDAIAHPPSPTHGVLLAQEGQWAVGFVALAPGEDGSALIGPLLVEARWGRRGHGSRLLAAAVDTLRLSGVHTARAWLLEADEVSRAFFASAGWAADGSARLLDTGAGQLREIGIHTTL